LAQYEEDLAFFNARGELAREVSPPRDAPPSPGRTPTHDSNTVDYRSERRSLARRERELEAIRASVGAASFHRSGAGVETYVGGHFRTLQTLGMTQRVQEVLEEAEEVEALQDQQRRRSPKNQVEEALLLTATNRSGP
jgi:hypothetical protein